MIGDREHPDTGDDHDDTLPLIDHMTRLNPPRFDLGSPMPPAWVELRGRIVVVRHTWPSGPSSASERMFPSMKAAEAGYANAVGYLMGRGYVDADV